MRFTTIPVPSRMQVYLKGFYDGVLLVGAYASKKIQDVKKQIQNDLIKDQHAVLYMEPEKKIVARSGEECVVALCDQWYLDYGENSNRFPSESSAAKSFFWCSL